MKKFYRIIAIKREQEYYGDNFWNAGYKYSYTPTSYAIKYMLKIMDNYIDKNIRANNIDMAVVKSIDEEEVIIKIVGRAKLIDKFITELCTTDTEFMKRFSMSSIPATYV